METFAIIFRSYRTMHRMCSDPDSKLDLMVPGGCDQLRVDSSHSEHLREVKRSSLVDESGKSARNTLEMLKNWTFSDRLHITNKQLLTTTGTIDTTGTTHTYPIKKEREFTMKLPLQARMIMSRKFVNWRILVTCEGACHVDDFRLLPASNHKGTQTNWQNRQTGT